jgi:hypothetical protein
MLFSPFVRAHGYCHAWPKISLNREKVIPFFFRRLRQPVYRFLSQQLRLTSG